ncbi:Yet3 protein [Martiniozyma asiatica (nom. inval.)]|nr:Yet3 protein [Martiniozyma asiatica]
MALQYHCAFVIMVTEVILFALISLPLPSKYRAPLLRALSTPFHSDHFNIATKCIFGFISIMFADSVNRVAKVTSELTARDGDPSGINAGVISRAEIQSRRFYAQRNMYLTGFSLFLSLVVYRTYSMVFELLEIKDKIKKLEKDGQVSENAETKQLKVQLEELAKEKEVLLAKCKALSDEY